MVSMCFLEQRIRALSSTARQMDLHILWREDPAGIWHFLFRPHSLSRRRRGPCVTKTGGRGCREAQLPLACVDE